MRITVLTGIHTNLVALEAVVKHIDSWGLDNVVVTDDIIIRGPRPAVCLAVIMEKQPTDGQLTRRGNHEDTFLL